MIKDATPLIDALRDPQSVSALGDGQWSELISIARAESLIGSLAHRLRGLDLPDRVQAIFDDAIDSHELVRTQALWEADCSRRALLYVEGKTVLMKGTAYVAAGLAAGVGRSIGDLDILVAKDKLPLVEEALLDAGWEWVKPDPYDDQYYREHMHELPPMIHRERDQMIDVHHTILPLTAKPMPDPQKMLEDAVELADGLFIMAPADMTCHCVAHVMADGDFAGGLRNLWDFHGLVTEFSAHNVRFWQQLEQRAQRHQLLQHVRWAAVLSHQLYGTAIPEQWSAGSKIRDRLTLHRLTARDGYGRETRKLTRLIFYIRSHWLRMPPMMLAKHLWTKFRRP
ncbi:nucleotidyltransferase domain-containing protein [Parasphingorhabdus sp.]|jgi:hypothetical protein|uniref:nucleotidyltransferase domain-containing protein n=1 Tax=Parasphingorhabdus sp. TaxID=2709688 RepID=UPI003D2D466F